MANSKKQYIFDLKRGDIAKLAKDNKNLRKKEVNISPNKIDNYRNARVLPVEMYKSDIGNSSGFRYCKEAVEWVVLARILEKRANFTVIETGNILNAYRDVFGINIDIIEKLFDADQAELLGRLQSLGVNFSTHDEHLTRIAVSIPTELPLKLRVFQLVLVNEENGHDISSIIDGYIIKLSELPSQNINIRADIAYKGVILEKALGKISFQLDGLDGVASKPPYMLPSNLKQLSQKKGDHAFSAVYQHTATEDSGIELTPLSIGYKVED